MVAIITDEEPVTRFSFGIEKAKTEVDPKTGDVIVYGKVTDCTVDTDDQIVDERWAAKAVQEWLASGGNVRVQHNPLRDPAGIGIEAHGDGKGGQWVRARIFEPIAKILVLGGALRAFSIGVMRPTVIADPIAKNGRIIDGILGEISLVDRPANKNCSFEYQLAKCFKGGALGWVGKMIGDTTTFLAKMGGSIDPATLNLLNSSGDDEVVTVDLPRDAAVTVTPRDLKKFLDARDGAAKRQFDRGVGGGVDRDKLPESDFAGPNRTYPIVTPGDVSDAGSLIGHADDPEAVKRRIMAIAHRKGPEFAAEIPDSWKKDSEEKSMDEPEVAKAGAKKCLGCGKNFHADSKLRNCDSCGKDLPHADKAATPDEDDVEKAKKPDAGDDKEDGNGKDTGDAGDGDEGDTDADDLATKGEALPPPVPPKPKKNKVNKGKVACAKCGSGMKGKSKFCSGCGHAVGTPDLAKKGIDKGKPTPADGVTGESAQPVPAHREPDGAAVEALEHDAHLPTDPDMELKTAMRQRGIGVTGDLGAVHDLLCPGFHPQVADAAHPGFSLKQMDVATWQLAAYDAASSATLEEAETATKRWQHATTISRASEDVLAELRYDLHKAFRDANPGPGSAPTPSTVTPGKFKRPYLTAGRARPSFQQEGPNTASVPSGQISASQYTRDFLPSGRAADSPANKGSDYLIQPPTTPGQLTRVEYNAALKANTLHAMDVMHGHIAQTFPDLCPMSPHSSTDAGPTTVTPAPVPQPIGKAAKAEETPAPVEKAEIETGAVEIPDGLDELLKALLPSLVKTAVSEALAPVTAELAETKAALKAQRKANKQLQETVDSMANLANPGTAPFRGEAMPGALKSFGQPVAAPTPADVATQARFAVERELENQFNTSDDPYQREQAWRALQGMRGMR